MRPLATTIVTLGVGPISSISTAEGIAVSLGQPLSDFCACTTKASTKNTKHKVS